MLFEIISHFSDFSVWPSLITLALRWLALSTRVKPPLRLATLTGITICVALVLPGGPKFAWYLPLFAMLAMALYANLFKDVTGVADNGPGHPEAWLSIIVFRNKLASVMSITSRETEISSRHTSAHSCLRSFDARILLHSPIEWKEWTYELRLRAWHK